MMFYDKLMIYELGNITCAYILRWVPSVNLSLYPYAITIMIYYDSELFLDNPYYGYVG